MTNKDHSNSRFSKFIFGSLEARQRHDKDVYEHQICKYMLTALKMTAHKKALLVAAKRLVGRAEYSLIAFHFLFEDFPCVIGADRLRGIPIPDIDKLTASDYEMHRCILSSEPDRFKNFNRVPFVQLFREFRENSEQVKASGKRAGLVFPCRGLRHGLIIHDDDTERSWETGSAWVYKGTKAKPEMLYIQPFGQFLAGIYAYGWRPTFDNNNEGKNE